MRNLIQYRYNLEELFFKFDTGKISNHNLIASLRKLEDVIRENGKFNLVQGLWFRFSPNDEKVTTLNDIAHAFMLREDNKERIRIMKGISDSYKLGNDIKIHFS